MDELRARLEARATRGRPRGAHAVLEAARLGPAPAEGPQARRRWWWLSAAAILIAAGLATAALLASGGDDDAPVVDDPPPGAAAACDAWLDLMEPMLLGDRERADPLLARFVELAEESSVPRLSEAAAKFDARFGPEVTAGLDGVPPEEWPETPADVCRDLGADGFDPQVVPGPLGPEPQVALDTYGTVHPFGSLTAALPEFVASSAWGPGVDAVEAMSTPAGGYVARWEGDIQRCVFWGHSAALATNGPDGPTGAPAPGTPFGNDRWTGRGNCASPPTSSDDLLPTEVEARENPAGWMLATAVGDEVSFVVVSTADGDIVQRPAMGMAVVVTGDAEPQVLRTFDRSGDQLDCSALADTATC